MHRGQIVSIDFEHGDVAAPVRAQNFCLVFAVIGELHRHLFGPIDHVRIGQHDAVRGDQKPGALRMHHAAILRPRYVAEKLRQRIVVVAGLAA